MQILFTQKAVDISREMSFCILVHFSVQFLSVIRLFGLWIAMVSLNCTPVITTKLSRGCLETGLRSDIRGKIRSDRWDITGLLFFFCQRQLVIKNHPGDLTQSETAKYFPLFLIGLCPTTYTGCY